MLHHSLISIMHFFKLLANNPTCFQYVSFKVDSLASDTFIISPVLQLDYNILTLHLTTLQIIKSGQCLVYKMVFVITDPLEKKSDG